ncbi:hypothetical protein KDA_30320 [Dictyobacter alpinus]|uniref:VOC domain-containing protein n=2 Tax=Dictyobacter alpinus TaxID=2014873 RepID=A0A402B872_9CHLR|nr:hypothetical protein KDA_30320 [Dictyobacter alpinus]
MDLLGFRLLVTDCSAAVHFWRDLLKFSPHVQDETPGYAYVDTSTVVRDLMRHDEFAAAMGSPVPVPVPVPVPQGRQVVIEVRVDDVDPTSAESITQGASAVSEPRDRPAWRARTAHVADPDGHMIEIFTSLPAW